MGHFNVALFLTVVGCGSVLSLSNDLHIIDSIPYIPKFEPNWASLDSRENPKWYDEAKFGIFVHWGVYSVPAHGTEWFWINWHNGKHSYVDYVKKNYKPNFTYQDFGPQFTASAFDPKRWAKLFKRSGAKYVIMTSKHHEGYTMFPSKYTFGWNSNDVGPKRDLVGELSHALRKSTNLKFGIYYSLFEWFNPMYLSDKANGYKTSEYVDKKMIPELTDAVNRYKPSFIWADGDWEAHEGYWKSKEFLAWLFNDSPVADTVLVNDRWGKGTNCKHGSVFNCKDRYNPNHLITHKWENAMTIDSSSWGYSQESSLDKYISSSDLIFTLVKTVSFGGNLLLNVGPTKEGYIIPIFEERLRDIGDWLKVNGDAIYGTTPWKHQKENKSETFWYTKKADQVFAIILAYPESNEVNLEQMLNEISPKTQVFMLGHKAPLVYTKEKDHLNIKLPNPVESFKISHIAWTLVFTDK